MKEVREMDVKFEVNGRYLAYKKELGVSAIGEEIVKEISPSGGYIRMEGRSWNRIEDWAIVEILP